MVDVHNVTAACDTKEVHVREYVKYLARGKYTIVSDEKSRQLNYPENRLDVGKPITKSTINNYLRNIKVFFNICTTTISLNQTLLQGLNR
jgi:integrase/recombinase XerD